MKIVMQKIICYLTKCITSNFYIYVHILKYKYIGPPEYKHNPFRDDVCILKQNLHINGLIIVMGR